MRAVLLVLVWLTAAPAFAQANWLGSYTWHLDDPHFGGFSGIELSEDGDRFTAVSDRGHFASGLISREDDHITDIVLETLTPLIGPDGQPLPKKFNDSEGLAIAPDGVTYVSFEWVHGVRAFPPRDGPSGPLITDPSFSDMQNNASFEALAIDADGALYTIPERSGMATHPFPVYRLENGVWDTPFSIPREGPYLIAGADIGPDNRLYVLERDFLGIGFRSRVRRFALDGSGAETVLETRVLTHDNLEGISIWQDGEGLRMTMISDDNFRSLQRTEIVEYRLTD